MEKDQAGGIASFGVSLGDDEGGGGTRDIGLDSPFRIVVVAELVARPDFSTGRTPPSEPISIDTENFDRVMGQLAPALAIEVDDPFGGAEPLRIDLVWRERKSMLPSEIREQVPVLRALADARRLVQDVVARRVSPEDARARLARMLPRPSWTLALVEEVRPAPPAREPARAAHSVPAPVVSSPQPETGGLDALLDMVDLVHAQPAASSRQPAGKPSASSDIARIVAAVAETARPGASPLPAATVGTAPARLERAFHRLLTSILRHPEVRRLEAAWRGLRLCVEHCDRRAGVRVDVFCAGPDDVAAALTRLVETHGDAAPVDLVVVDQALAATVVDLSRLEKWAAVAEELLAPIVVGGHPNMLGADALAAVAHSTSALATVADPRAVAVRAVASRDAARWVAVVLNDPLVRGPYTASSSRQKDPPFDEDPRDLAAHVFANGTYVVASLCAKSYARIRWPTAITGARDGTLGNLPVHMASEGEREWAIPLEDAPSEGALREVARAGFIMLACAPNTDNAALVRAPMLHRSGGGNGASTATLGDQLFAGRLARAVQRVARSIPKDSDPREAAESARATLSGLFEEAPGAGPEVEAEVDSASHTLVVTVRPHRFAGVSVEELTFSAPCG